MDQNDNPQDMDELLDFSLDDILNEFHEDPDSEPSLDPELNGFLNQYSPEQAQPEEAAPAPEIPAAPQEDGETPPAVSVDTIAFTAPPQQPQAAPDATVQFTPVAPETAAEAQQPSPEDDLDSLLADADAQLQEPGTEESPEADAMSGETVRMDSVEEPDTPVPPVQEEDPRLRLRDLKRKLVAGPEKRYYELSEMGLGKLQVSILINVAVVLICAVASVFFYAGKVPEDRMRLLIFSQVLAMLVSALMGSHQLIDGFAELLHGRFTVNTMLGMTFLACCVDAVFCLRDLRVPCCAAFSLEMTLALCARYQARNTEMAQMDTLRKAVRLRSLVKSPDFYQGAPGLLRGEGQLEDFWDIYNVSSGPRKLQSVYAFVSFLICLGISALAGVLHGAGLAVQILSTSLLVALPASAFISLTRPASLLSRRLHMVGTVLCGWQGVKGLSSRLVFPLTDSDLFPQGSTKLNGVKFYSDRDPDMIISYTASLILAAGGGLVPVFQQLMTSRGVAQNPVQNLQDYGTGGIGGEVCGENVLLGTYSFLQSMGVEIPEGTMVNQAVYAAIDGQLCAVVAISYARMRSAAAGMVTICGYRKLTPILTGADFLLTEGYIRSKFEIKSRRLLFPDPETRRALGSVVPDPSLPSLALVTREDLASYAYAVTGARALRTSCLLGMGLHLFGGILGILIMVVLAILGSTELLTPMNILLYQLVWLIPGLLITEWTRNV